MIFEFVVLTVKSEMLHLKIAPGILYMSTLPLHPIEERKCFVEDLDFHLKFILIWLRISRVMSYSLDGLRRTV